MARSPLFQTDELVPLSEVGAMIRPERPISLSTVYRWATVGVRGRTLKTVLVGGRRYCTSERIKQFIEALNR